MARGQQKIQSQQKMPKSRLDKRRNKDMTKRLLPKLP
uniref:Zfp706 protein n=1 Tax=Mus musculus TaxID=10090 RepID=Q7TMZ1_MOUSE|nr:Zfp706 protein [Mus musculus]